MIFHFKKLKPDSYRSHETGLYFIFKSPVFFVTHCIISTDKNSRLGRTEIIKYEIKVTENPIKSKLYPVKDNKREKWMKEEIE